MKNKAKGKAAAIRRNQQGTGGGLQFNQRLTDFEERMVAFLTQEAVHGLEVPAGLALDSEELQAVTACTEPVAGPSYEVMAECSSAIDSHEEDVSQVSRENELFLSYFYETKFITTPTRKCIMCVTPIKQIILFAVNL